LPALTFTSLRDRAHVGIMTYTLARVNAVLQMKVRVDFVQGRMGGAARKRCEGVRGSLSPNLSSISTNTLRLSALRITPSTAHNVRPVHYDPALPLFGPVDLNMNPLCSVVRQKIDGQGAYPE
jgi:hypothetical protein